MLFNNNFYKRPILKMLNQSQEIQKNRLIEKMKREFGSDVVKYLSDDDVTEIILNDDGLLWVEKHGCPMEQIGRLEYNKAEAAIKSVAAFMNAFATEENPIIEGVMPIDGTSRFLEFYRQYHKNLVFVFVDILQKL